jgi:hypothetical protein
MEFHRGLPFTEDSQAASDFSTFETAITPAAIVAATGILGMNARRQLYIAGAIGASISYIFNVLAFTGEFDVIRWSVFMILFLVVFAGFEKLIEWAERTESE